MKDLATLKAACDAVIADPKLSPIKDPNTGAILATHCNLGAMRIAHAMGCDDLQGLLADDQYWVMDNNASGNWIKLSPEMAAAAAQQGQLVFAAMTSEMLKESHGHITACYPAPMQMSPSLNRLVPMVCNIGRVDLEERESQAFPVAQGEPDYFAYTG